MRIVFLGTGDIALPSLNWLIASDDHEVVGVVTQPDRPVGRKQKLTPSQIKVAALEAQIPVEQPEKIRKDLGFLEAWDPEVIVVMAYGQILPVALLKLPSLACINLHASLLPRHRGASPIQAAIREGDTDSGITVMHIAKGLDTGDIILPKSIPLTPDETGGSLHDRLADLAPVALEEGLALLASGDATRTPQDEALATYASKLTREDGEVDWTRPATEIERALRAYHPWPGLATSLPCSEGKRPLRLKLYPPADILDLAGQPGEILDAEGLVVATGAGALRLRQVQVEGCRRMSCEEFLNGRDFPPGACLGKGSGSASPS